MKLTKKLETEILKVYNAYWRGYLKGDVKGMSSLLVDDYTQVGSAETEVFSNKKAAVKFLKDTIDQVAGKTEMRHRSTRIEQQGNLILLHELCDLYVLADAEWMFYAKFRASTLMQKKKNSWKIVHQHSSFPDARAGEGENIATDKIAEENRQLREAVKRRTIELENKNRALEIETALEKVRTVALSMKEPADMPEVCKTISLQMQSLGVKEIRNVQTAIFYESRGTYMNYEYYAKHKKTTVTETSYTNHKVHKAFAAKMLKGKGEVFITHIKGKKVKDWIAYQKTTNVFIDRFLEEANSLNYYWHSLGPVALGISTYLPLSKEELSLFGRFLNVFELAYTRYLDIEQAHSQARESQIQASLEKVRAQALGMRKPEDLPDVCEVLFKELQTLGFSELRNTMVNIHNDEKETFLNYDYSDAIGKSITPLFYDIHPVIEKQIQQIRSAPDAFSETVFTGKYLAEWKKFRKRSGEKDDPRIKNITALHYYFYSIGTGSIGISTFSSIGEEKLELLKRFRNVFDFAYRRYMDVAQAEAHAKETQIELSLERVRARSMAMHSSDELVEAADVVFQQLKTLGIESIRTGIATFDESAETIEVWSRAHTDKQSAKKILGVVPKNSHTFFVGCFDAWKRKEKFYCQEFVGSEVVEYYHIMSSILSYPQSKSYNPKEVFYTFFFPEGSINVVRQEKLTDEELTIMERFASVFGLIYRRFLDLQTVEAQAREAKIEASLERVRSRTMAMQRSAELGDVAAELFAQMNELVTNLWTCGFVLCEKDRDEDEWWLSMDSGFTRGFLLPNVGDYTHATLYAGWLKGDSFRTVQLEGKGLQEHYDWLMQIPVSRRIFEEMTAAGLERPEWQKLHAAYFSRGYLVLITREPCGEEEIFKRFAQVFDLIYTRFLDLQKAEAQAREAQIEAALERVRAQAMSMRKSEELLNVCESIFKQLQALGFSDDILRNSQIVINQDEKGFYYGYQYSDYAGAEFAEVSYNLHPVIKFLSDKLRQSSEAFADIAITGESLDDWKRFVNSFPQKHDDKLNAASELHYYFYSVGIGALGISTFKSITELQSDILKRFRNVFDLSYKRYTDIALAEAQAREAQIQLALERVRARTMAMQKSEELAETAAVLFQQFKEIDKAPKMLTIGIMNEKEGLIEFWVTDWSGGGSKVNRKFDASIEEPVLLNKIFAAWKEQRKSTVIELVGKKLQDWIDYRVRLSGIPDDNDYSSRRGFVIAAFFSKGMLSISAYEPRPPETVQLLERFAGVFDLTYTRFLDLQKAEAQARESQIQLALERVRARTMAMQHSDELQDAAILLFDQMKALGVHTGSCGFNIWNKKEKTATVWVSSPEGGLQTPFEMPHTESAIYKQVFEAMEKSQDFFVEEVGGKTLEKHFDYLLTLPGIGQVIKQLRETGYVFPETMVYHFAFFDKGYLSFHLHEHHPETHDIFKRFAKVFEQTYTRFLDLQKAEAQAREAQIEASLERIRARAMAMHGSDELMDVAGILREQMGLLGQPELETSVINLFEENSDQVLSWHAFRSPELSSGKIITGVASFRWDSNAISREMMEVYRSGQQEYTMETDGAKAMELVRVLVTAAPEIARYVGESIPERVCYHLSYFSGGALLMVSYQPPSEEARSLQRRAASVFDMAYRRYCDLKKAEAQTREATIEASLEKVRGKAMAMHTSSDISETMGVVFSELPKLGIGSLRCGVALLSKDSRRVIFYAAADALESDSLTLIGTGEMSGHPEFENQYECWLKQENYFVTLSDEALRSYYEALAARLSAPYTPREHREQTEHGYYFPFSTGNFYAWSEKPYSESEIDILQRFKAIIDLTFRRYLDLKQAEVQTREAQIETSLERVRSRTLAMQKSDELAETAAVLFRQLITLGIAPNRLYIAIMKDERGNAEFWITDEDGSKVSTGFSANLRGNGSFQKMLTGWQEGTKSITIDMQGKELQEYFQHLSSLSVPFKGGLSQTRRVQNIAYFSRGFIGMASPDTQPEETTTLLERFAAVFNLTLTRFNDLKLAEAQAHQAHLDLIQLQTEKKRAEDALSELSATQAQLVQQEKLASLGQLTAGIAHEIKNPLNFVNNFSSVSVELVDEAIEEIKKFSGNGGDARQLLDDVKKNLNKIIEHGTRADGIVKSMLQHSRDGSGKKEPVDLNALVKEYVNLAFHGMRASKNPINVDIALDLQDSIGKVPVIAEDFSRVIINLCQNAFDAMREKVNTGSKQSGSYLPKLIVRTRREADRIIVEVGDNGPGIPEAIKDKILQPFFTTKKGTQGTGLGLSITHDIVKAHGGEMKIETNADGGATFRIWLLP